MRSALRRSSRLGSCRHCPEAAFSSTSTDAPALPPPRKFTGSAEDRALLLSKLHTSAIAAAAAGLPPPPPTPPTPPPPQLPPPSLQHAHAGTSQVVTGLEGMEDYHLRLITPQSPLYTATLRESPFAVRQSAIGLAAAHNHPTIRPLHSSSAPHPPLALPPAPFRRAVVGISVARQLRHLPILRGRGARAAGRGPRSGLRHWVWRRGGGGEAGRRQERAIERHRSVEHAHCEHKHGPERRCRRRRRRRRQWRVRAARDDREFDRQTGR